MFKQLSSLIPGFQISSESSFPSSKSNSSQSKVDLRVLIEESNTCGGEFVLCSLLELLLRQNVKVVFVGVQNSFTHYAAVLKKLGINLQ